MISVNDYISRFKLIFGSLTTKTPWHLTALAREILLKKIDGLGQDYKIFRNVAIHKTVVIDSHAILKGPAIISANCFIGPHTCIRDGVFLDENVSLGPGTEVKTSFLFAHTALAHFNYVGDSILGSNVNLEAGAVIANHYNERADKNIFAKIGNDLVSTEVEKFGALIGDQCKVGANAVLSPGTILPADSIVKRLELVDQTGAPPE